MISSGSSNAGIDRLDVGAERLRARATAAATAAATSGCDLRVAERRREGDAQAADAVVEADRVVASGRTAARSSRARRGASARSSSAPRRRRSSCAGRGGRPCPSARADTPARGRSSASGRSCRRTRPGCGRCRRRRCRPRAAPCRRRPPRRCRPTSRPASCAGFHGIARDAGERRVGLALAAELGRRRLAEDHRAGFAQARGRRRVDVPRPAPDRRCASRAASASRRRGSGP